MKYPAFPRGDFYSAEQAAEQRAARIAARAVVQFAAVALRPAGGRLLQTVRPPVLQSLLRAVPLPVPLNKNPRVETRGISFSGITLNFTGYA